jgi:hypothetical protein
MGSVSDGGLAGSGGRPKRQRQAAVGGRGVLRLVQLGKLTSLYMRKHTRTSQFLSRPWDVETRSVPDHLVDDHTFIPRLTWRALPLVPTTASDVVNMIGEGAGHAWFVDNSFIDDDRDRTVIEALIEPPNQVHLVAPVLAELAPWLDRRPSHPLTRAIRDKDPSIVMPSMPTEGNGSHVFNYYTGLLAMRRRITPLVRDSLQDSGRAHETQDQAAVLAHLQRQFGDRGRLLATKDAGPMHTDEIVVYMAVEHALRTGQPTMILANDADVEEQFFKLVWLMSGHYRAMHCARSYMADHGAHRLASPPASALNQPDRPIEPTGAILVDGGWGPKLEGAIPPSPFVPISCFNGRDRVTQITFGGERGMADLLNVKDKTRGMSSDLLGARNVHAPVPMHLLPGDGRHYVLLARDRTLESAKPLHLSLLDAHFAVLNSERPGHVRMVPAKPASRVLPPPESERFAHAD